MSSETKTDGLFVSPNSAKPLLVAVLMSRTKLPTRQEHEDLKKLRCHLKTAQKTNSYFFKSPYVHQGKPWNQQSKVLLTGLNFEVCVYAKSRVCRQKDCKPKSLSNLFACAKVKASNRKSYAGKSKSEKEKDFPSLLAELKGMCLPESVSLTRRTGWKNMGFWKSSVSA